MRRWCREAGFPILGQNKAPALSDDYKTTYHRKQKWITEAFGKPDDNWPEGNFVGYDVGEHARAWLKEFGDKKKRDEKGNPTQSVLEVLLDRDWPEVSVANCFYSHIQVQGFGLSPEGTPEPRPTHITTHEPATRRRARLAGQVAAPHTRGNGDGLRGVPRGPEGQER